MTFEQEIIAEQREIWMGVFKHVRPFERDLPYRTEWAIDITMDFDPCCVEDMRSWMQAMITDRYKHKWTGIEVQLSKLDYRPHKIDVVLEDGFSMTGVCPKTIEFNTLDHRHDTLDFIRVIFGVDSWTRGDKRVQIVWSG